mgnify:CR=1 FL=1
MYKNIILPAGLLAGTIIGAGVFALPYVFVKAGILTGLFYLIIFSAVFVLIHLMYADIVIRTPENRRFAGYMEIYFGKFGFWLAFLMSVLGSILALTIYLVLSVSFINLILPNIGDVYKLLIFWLIGSLAIFLNINKVVFSEFLVSLGIILIISAIFIFGLGNIGRLQSASLFNYGNLFLPYGVVLFSMVGRTAITSLLGYFRANGQSLVLAKKPIILGTILPAFIYVFFVIGVIGLSKTVSEDSVSGLIDNLPNPILLALAVMGIVSLWSTYIVIGRDIKKSFEHDLNFSHFISGLIVVASPLILYAVGFQQFIKLVGLAGAIFVGLEGIFIILMWLKAQKHAELTQNNAENKILDKINPLIIYFLLLVFAGGIVYALLVNNFVE